MCQPHILTTTEITYDSEGKIEKTKVIQKEQDPSVTAIFKYLLCKDRQNWSESIGTIDGNDGRITIVVDRADKDL
jgi:hypothetical protein